MHWVVGLYIGVQCRPATGLGLVAVRLHAGVLQPLRDVKAYNCYDVKCLNAFKL
jgi:hypothetical protein